MRKALRKAIFPVGGLGTRFLPATKAMPKEMLSVVDKPLIQYAVEEADAPCLRQMVEVYNEVGGNVVAVMDVPREHTNRYGVLKIGKEQGRIVEVEGLVEKPKPEEAPSTLSIIGRYILQPDTFAFLEQQKPGAGGEIQLTDALAQMTGRGRFHRYRLEGRRFDCGDKAGFIEANIAFALKHPKIGKSVRQLVLDYAKEITG